MKNLILASNNAHKVEEIKQILTNYNILTLKDIGFTEDISYHSYGLVTVKNNETLIGKSHTKITVKSPIFKEKTITHYEFQRKLVQYSP